MNFYQFKIKVIWTLTYLNVLSFLIWFRNQEGIRGVIYWALNSSKVNIVASNISDLVQQNYMMRWDSLTPFSLPLSCSFYILCSWYNGLSLEQFFTILSRRKGEVSEDLKHAMRKTDRPWPVTGLPRGRVCTYQSFAGNGRQKTANWFSEISLSQSQLD